MERHQDRNRHNNDCPDGIKKHNQKMTVLTIGDHPVKGNISMAGRFASARMCPAPFLNGSPGGCTKQPRWSHSAAHHGNYVGKEQEPERTTIMGCSHWLSIHGHSRPGVTRLRFRVKNRLGRPRTSNCVTRSCRFGYTPNPSRLAVAVILMNRVVTFL